MVLLDALRRCRQSFYPCAVTDDVLCPVRIDIINKRTSGCFGQSPSYFAEWKTFLLTWMQQSWPSSPENGFAASLVKHFSKNSKSCIFEIQRDYFKTWKHTDLGNNISFYPNSTREIVLIHKTESMLKFTISEATNNPNESKQGHFSVTWC